MSVRAQTGNKYEAQEDDSGDPRLEITLTNGHVYIADITGDKERDSYTIRELKVKEFSGDHRANCFTRSQIVNVALVADNNDGWYVHSIATYLGNPGDPFVKLTCDPDFKKWVDKNEWWLYHSYNATYHTLSLFDAIPSHHHCIRSLKIIARTGTNGDAGFASWKMFGNTHLIQLVLRDGTVLKGEFKSPAEKGKDYLLEIVLEDDFNAWCMCVKRGDIKQVKIRAGGSDGWLISSIVTKYFTNESGDNRLLTSDQFFEKWLDSNDEDDYNYNAKEHILTLQPFVDTPTCGYGVPVCECAEGAKTCIFNLEIVKMMTFVSYQKFGIGVGEGLFVHGREAVLYYIDETTGLSEPHPAHVNRKCGLTWNENECSVPQFVDGKTFRSVTAINGQVPGPTIVVQEGQEVVINVHNNMKTEGISIHWHGMYQNGTPWMDGVGQVTQCQIGPASTYTYIYMAKPSGTFWYHSHTGGQRMDGFYGALIVKETHAHHAMVKDELQKYDVGDFLDLPDQHTLSLLDWQHKSSIDMATQSNGGLGFFPDIEVGEVSPPTVSPYRITFGVENARISPVPYYSGLINGKGRHEDVPYSKTRLSVFTVEQGQRYRFRLIGAQGVCAYKVAIDGHKLTVVNVDGFWTQPVKDVDYVIIHTGERYDFILEANAPMFMNYWIRIETLETNVFASWPPYQSLGHLAEGILQYKRPNEDAPIIESTEYEGIKLNSPKRVCTANDPCKAVNCPFKDYHLSYYTECVNIHKMQLLFPTPSYEMPDSTPCTEEGCRYFLNFIFEGNSGQGSINGRNFELPPAPPQTQNESFYEQAVICDNDKFCNPSTFACLCTHLITLPFDKTIQLVLTAHGGIDAVHPIHVHGHTFHVVKVGYPEYDPYTGFIKRESINGQRVSVHNDDITCEDETICSQPGSECDPTKCTRPRWTDMENPPVTTVNIYTICKDTVMVPAGGYVVIHFKSNNPGYWFLHCHIESDLLQGMALIMREAPEQQEDLPVPENLNKCGDFTLTVDEYMKFVGIG